ncbi:MAG: methylated-DNA--[protein]-cysteine S-methyltransferase [Gemmataceae bacterium]|nr:methylated-DNA--[protein]-cysteine S-methyltransferase [Gemmataceae bacterium]
MRYMTIPSPIGTLMLVGDETALKQIRFGREAETVPADWVRDDEALREARRQLEEYFRGERTEFDLPLAPEGTVFQKRVWQALLAVEYGASACYQEIAHALGNPTGARAVGLANSRNPLPIVIPCHRIIGKSGTLVGYAGGLEIKKFLLAHEGIGSRERTLEFAS